MTQDDAGSAPVLGSHVVAYAVIDDEGVQHSLWFLAKDAIGEAAMVGGTVVRLCRPTLTNEEREAIASVLNRLCGHMTPGERSALLGMLERTT
jgi:hypothetical protein